MNQTQKHKDEMSALQKEQRRKVKSKLVDRGVVIVNTGSGKGKSTAAFGTAIRAAGYGYKVGIVQFIKGSWRTGEEEAFKKFSEVDYFICGEGFTWDTQDKSKDIAAVERGWEIVLEMVEAVRNGKKKYHLIVLDELNIALSLGYFSVEKVVDLVKNKPEELNIIITGRDAPDELIKAADTVTEMVPVKHAFEDGIKAQKGIEF